jgi:hypothetical protein
VYSDNLNCFDNCIDTLLFSYLYLHLRPELVRNWRGKPLNSDAFSPFAQVDDPQTRTQHENEIKAVLKLYQSINQPQTVFF